MSDPTKTTKKVRNPFTGKMEVYTPRPVAAPLDMVDPPKVTTKVKEERGEELKKQMAKMRKKYADIGPSKRSGITGTKLAQEYRRLTLEYQYIFHEKPPGVDAEL